MKLEPARYTSRRMSLADFCSSISRLERRRREVACLEDLVALAELLLLRGDLLGCIADHDLAEAAAEEAGASFPTAATANLIRARVAARFHRFKESHALLDLAMVTGGSRRQIMSTRAALLQSTGKFWEALELRDRLAREHHGIETLGALATLSVEMGQFALAEMLYAEALNADDGVSPLPCAQLLYEWGVGAMRHGDLDRAEDIFVQLEAVLPWHIPGRGRRAEIALARDQVETAAALIESPLEASDDPEYLALHAEILAARGEHAEAAHESQRAAAAYESLLARRPEAYADRAAAFFMGAGNQPLLAVELAAKNRSLRDSPCSRALLSKARRAAAARRARWTVPTIPAVDWRH
jgi:tetratricopeptide (TPR) repeat protein